MRSARRPKSHATFSLLQGADLSGFIQLRERQKHNRHQIHNEFQKIQNLRTQETEFVPYEVQVQTQTYMLHSSQEKNSVDPLMRKVTCCSQCDKQRGKWSMGGEAIAEALREKSCPFQEVQGPAQSKVQSAAC